MTLLIGNRDRIDDCASRQREARSRRFSTRLAHTYILRGQVGADPCRSTSSPVGARMTPRAPARSRSSGSTGAVSGGFAGPRPSPTHVVSSAQRWRAMPSASITRPHALSQPLRRIGEKGAGLDAFRPISWDRALAVFATSCRRSSDEPRLPPAATRSRLRLRRRHQLDRSHCTWARHSFGKKASQAAWYQVESSLRRPDALSGSHGAAQLP